MPGTPTTGAICRLALVALVCALLCGCASGPPPPVSAQELAAAETFPYFRVYWVGDAFAGSPLTAVDDRSSYVPATGESVYYGTCVHDHGGLLGQGACRLPLRVTTVVFVPHSNAPLGAQRNTLIRGVPAVVYEGGRSIELYSGHLAIDIYADTAAHALLATRLLRPLNAAGAAGEALPAPTYCPDLSGAVPAAVVRAMMSLPDRPCQLSREAEEGPASATKAR